MLFCTFKIFTICRFLCKLGPAFQIRPPDKKAPTHLRSFLLVWDDPISDKFYISFNSEHLQAMFSDGVSSLMVSHLKDWISKDLKRRVEKYEKYEKYDTPVSNTSFD